MPLIWFVHGAGATEHSFTWLREKMLPHTAKFLCYENSTSAESCVQRLCQRASEEVEPVFLIGHSLGGIITRAVASRIQIAGLITLCAPFGGIKHAEVMSLMCRAPMFKELSQFSSLLLDIRTNKINTPHLAVVGTRGLPHFSEPNDGVVTLASQTAIADRAYLTIPLNHFEVLLSPVVADAVNQFLLEQSI